MTAQERSITGPVVSYDERSETWLLERGYSVLVLDYLLRVPVGFRTDLASIPRWLWPIVAPFELSLAAPIVHDWLYANGGRTNVLAVTVSRETTDRIFFELMRRENVWWWRRALAYRAVRLFGAKHWKPIHDPRPQGLLARDRE